MRFDPGLDPTLPQVTLVLGGKERPLAYDMAAIMRVEKLTGIDLMTAALTGVTATELCTLVWAALLPADPDLTLEQAASLINFNNGATCLQAVRAAWLGSVPEPKDDAPPGEARPRARRRKA